MTFINFLKGYTINFTSTAKRKLKKMDDGDVCTIKNSLQMLVAGQQNINVKKMAGKKVPTFRLRSGDYRILFEIYKQKIVVLVISLGHRKEIYKK